MNTYIKKLFEIIDFNNSDIFNTEESYYNYNEKDSMIYKTIENKILNEKAVSEEESIFYFKCVHEIPENILKKLLKAETGTNGIIKGLSENNVKYKVSSKEELIEIINKYSKKNPTASLNWIDTSNITDMSELFRLSKYNGDISEWNTSNVTNMSCMFYNDRTFNQPIGNWDVSHVIDMHSMFWNAESFNQLIGNWDISNVRNMAHMFGGAKSFNQPIGDWNVSNVTNMACMFCDAESFNQPIGDWDVSNVEYMTLMFCEAKSFNQPIKDWDVSQVKNMLYMFYRAESFNQNLRNWILNPDVIRKEMFNKCPIEKIYKPRINKKIYYEYKKKNI